MMLTAILCGLSLLLGVQLGATWPWLRFRITRPLRSRHEETPMAAPTDPRRLVWILRAFVALMALVFLTGLAQIVTYATVQGNASDVADYQRCQSEYQQQFATAYQARADASIASTQALDKVVAAVASGSDRRFREALQNYIKVRADQTRERARNPLPPLPDKVCGPAPSGDPR